MYTLTIQYAYMQEGFVSYRVCVANISNRAAIDWQKGLVQNI